MAFETTSQPNLYFKATFKFLFPYMEITFVLHTVEPQLSELIGTTRHFKWIIDNQDIEQPVDALNQRAQV